MSGARLRRAVSEQDKQGRRADILSAAKTVFADNGYHGTTMGDVAKAAGLSYGSVYWYFESKDTLFHELMEVEAQSLRRRVQAAMAGAAGDPEAEFRAGVRATFEFFEADKAAVKLLFRDSYALGDRFEKHLLGIYGGFISDVEASIVDAQRGGHVVAYPPRMAAFSVAALIGQLALRRVFTDDGLDAGAVADLVVDLLLKGLLPRPPDGGLH